MISLLVGVAALAQPSGTAVQVEEAAAQRATDGAAREREAIIVIAGGNLAPPASTLVQHVTPVQLPRQGLGERVENRLRDEAGIVQFRRSDSRSAHPTSQGVTLRGLGGNASSRALVTLDGVPQADPFGGWIAWSSFDAINLGGLVVTRGGGSGADGPGALAGTIALNSALSDGVEASAAAGSRGSRDAAAHVGARLGGGEVGIDGRYARSDGFIPVRSSQRGAADQRAPFEQAGLGIRLRIDGGESRRIEASLRGFSDRRNRGVDFTRSDVGGIDASLRYISEPADALQWMALGYAQLREFDTGFASVAADRSVAAPVLAQHVPALGLGARIELRPLIGERHPLRLGADWRRTEGRTEEDFFFIGLVPNRHRSAGGANDSVGAFAEFIAGAPGDEWIIAASARIDHWTIGEGFRREGAIGGARTTDLRFGSRSGWEAGGRAGVRWTSRDVALRAAAYRGWRLPTLNELYRPFRVGQETTLANAHLRPERLLGGEVGADWDRGPTSLAATLFVNRLSRAIANVTIAPNLNERDNLDAIDSKGVEITAIHRRSWGTIRASYAFTDAKVEASARAARLDGKRPAQIARHGGSLAVATSETASLGGFARLRYIGAQNEDDLGLQRLAAALTLDAGARWRIARNLEIEANAENILDELVPAAVSSAGIVERAAPRTLWIGIRFGI